MLAELMRLKQGIAIAGTHGKTTTTSLVTSVLAEAGRRPDVRDRRAPQQRRRAFAAGRGRLHRGRGRRERRLVPQPESDPERGHQHRRRPHGDLRPRHRPAAPGVHRVPAPHAVLRRGDRLRRRPRRAGDHRCDLAPGDPLRPRRRHAGARHRSDRAAGRAHALSSAQRRNGAAMPTLDITLNLAGVHNVRNALAAIAVATELELPDAPVVKALAEFTGVGRRFQRYGDLPARDGGVLHADRRLRPPPGGSGRGARRGARRVPRAAHRAGVPAASLQPHARLFRRLRQGAWPGRCGAADRGLPGGRSSRSSPPTAVRWRARCAWRAMSIRCSSTTSPSWRRR